MSHRMIKTHPETIRVPFSWFANVQEALRFHARNQDCEHCQILQDQSLKLMEHDLRAKANAEGK